jgi:ketosteroid isomerase-like protein
MNIGRLICGLTAALMTCSSLAFAAPVDDAVASVTATLDKLNGGDVDAFVTAHTDGALIVDEFAPFVWTGSGSVQKWLGDYGRDATTRGISAGRIDYGKPIQANGHENSAYIVLPTTYRFMQKGQKMAGAGSMTFVMARSGAGWKISSWTYAGATPTPEG